MLSPKKRTQAVLECYEELYKAAVPSVSFQHLNETCTVYEDSDYREHVTETPLTDIERETRGWRKKIPMDAYYLPREKYEGIVSAIEKKYKMSKSEKIRFRFQAYLGCGPTTNFDTFHKSRYPEYTKDELMAMVKEQGYPEPESRMS